MAAHSANHDSPTRALFADTGAADSSHDVDAACAMCQRPGARQSYVQWGRQECTNGHVQEYNGLVMGTHYSQHKSEHVCVDYARMGHAASSTVAAMHVRLFPPQKPHAENETQSPQSSTAAQSNTLHATPTKPASHAQVPLSRHAPWPEH